MLGNPRAAIYGTIAVGALLAAESAQRETYLETVAAVLITLLMYWLAHSYAEVTVRRLRSSEPLRLAELARTSARELSILTGAAIPLLVLLISWAVGAKLTSAVTGAVWASAGMVVIIELILALRAELSGRKLLLQIALGTLLGVLVIVVKLVLH